MFPWIVFALLNWKKDVKNSQYFCMKVIVNTFIILHSFLYKIDIDSRVTVIRKRKLNKLHISLIFRQEQKKLQIVLS